MSLAMPRPLARMISRISDGLLSVRDRLVSNLEFQRKAQRFPLIRRIADRQACKLFDLCAGFVYSQVLYACVDVGLLEILRQGPQSLEEIAAKTSLDRRAAETLVKAAQSLELISRRSSSRYGLGPLGAALCGHAGLLSMIRHHRMFYDDLRDPVALLRGQFQDSELSRYWAYAPRDGRELRDEDVASYTALMSASQSLVAEQILDALPLTPGQTLLDIGGGDGEFILRAARRYPDLRFKHLDLPAVSARAGRRFAEEGRSVHVEIVPGSFLDDPLPRGADIVTLIRVVHDHNDEAVAHLFRRIRGVLGPGGTLVVAEPLAGTSGCEAMGDAYFAFYLMAMGQGRPRGADEIKQMIAAAGFSSVRELPSASPLQVRILAATA